MQAVGQATEIHVSIHCVIRYRIFFLTVQPKSKKSYSESKTLIIVICLFDNVTIEKRELAMPRPNRLFHCLSTYSTPQLSL